MAVQQFSHAAWACNACQVVAINLADSELSRWKGLQELLQQERAMVCSQIREEGIDRSHLHTVVRDYLVAHAYEDTLSHFDQAYSERALPCLCASRHHLVLDICSSFARVLHCTYTAAFHR